MRSLGRLARTRHPRTSVLRQANPPRLLLGGLLLSRLLGSTPRSGSLPGAANCIQLQGQGRNVTSQEWICKRIETAGIDTAQQITPAFTSVYRLRSRARWGSLTRPDAGFAPSGRPAGGRIAAVEAGRQNLSWRAAEGGEALNRREPGGRKLRRQTGRYFRVRLEAVLARVALFSAERSWRPVRCWIRTSSCARRKSRR